MRRPALAHVALAALAAALLPSLATAAQPTAAAPPPPAEPFAFEAYQLVLLVRPAEREELPDERVQEIQRAHLAHLDAMAAAGHLLIAGPFGDQEDESLRGLALYQVGSVEEARRLAEADPAVQAGRLEVEVMTWYVGEGYMAFPKRPLPAEGGEAADDCADAGTAPCGDGEGPAAEPAEPPAPGR